MPFAETLLALLADEERGLGPVHFVRGSVRGARIVREKMREPAGVAAHDRVGCLFEA